MKIPRLLEKQSGRFPIYKTVPNPESRVEKFTKATMAIAMGELAKGAIKLPATSIPREILAKSQEK